MKRDSLISEYPKSGAKMQDFFDFYNSIKEFNSNGETKSTKVRYSYSGDIINDNNKEKRKNNLKYYLQNLLIDLRLFHHPI